MDYTTALLLMKLTGEIEPVSRLKEVGALIDRIDSLFVVMKV